MTSSILCALVWVLTPVVLLVAFLGWLTESRTQRIRRWHQAGHSQRAIAERLGISRHRVAKALA